VATALEAIAGAGLKESPLPFDAFGRTPNSIAHKAFSVGIGGSNAMDDRQRPTEGAMLQTDLDITFAFRLRPLDQLTPLYWIEAMQRYIQTYTSNLFQPVEH
jgi:hypothetical protein